MKQSKFLNFDKNLENNTEIPEVLLDKFKEFVMDYNKVVNVR